MNTSYYPDKINKQDLFSIENGKNIDSRLATHLYNSKLFAFCDSIPYLNYGSYYKCITYDEAYALARRLIAPSDRLLVASRSIKEAFERIKDIPELQLNLDVTAEKNKQYINLLNGVYDIKSKKLCEHDNKYPFNYKLNFSYVSDKERKLDTFNTYIRTSIGEENRKCLLITIGLAMSSIRDFKKAVVLIGPPDSGKSKILDLIEKAVGDTYVTSNPFHKIGSEKAIASYAGGKRINLSRDIKLGLIKEDEGFKSVVSCEKITGRLLYHNEISITPKVMCIAASNIFPRFKNADDACIKRIIPIRIQGYTGIPDPNFADKLFKEKDSICSLAIDILSEFISSGYDFCMSEDSRMLLEQEVTKLHTAKSFIDECYYLNSDGKISSVKLYNHYTKWCSENAVDPMGKTHFYDEIKAISNDIIYKKVNVGDKYVNGFTGLKEKNLQSDDSMIVERRN